MPVDGTDSRQRAENVGDARDAKQARRHATHPGGPANGHVRQRADDHADSGHRHHLLGAVVDDVGPDPDEQGVGERSREPDRGGIAVPRQVKPEHLAERDQRAERDRDPWILQAVSRGLRYRDHQPHPGGHHEQQLTRIPYLPGIPAELMSSHAHCVCSLASGAPPAFSAHGGLPPPYPLAHPSSLAPPCWPGRLPRRALVARSSLLSPGAAAPLRLAHCDVRGCR